MKNCVKVSSTGCFEYSIIQAIHVRGRWGSVQGEKYPGMTSYT